MVVIGETVDAAALPPYSSSLQENRSVVGYGPAMVDEDQGASGRRLWWEMLILEEVRRDLVDMGGPIDVEIEIRFASGRR